MIRPSVSTLGVLLLLTLTAPAAEPLRTVRDFGAVGDGQADDTAALQAAVEAGGDVLLPRGIYRITQPVVVELDRVGPVGIAGLGTARIVMAGPGPALRLIGTHEGSADPGSFQPNVWVRQRMPSVVGIEVVGDHAEACGIEARGTMQLTVSRVNIRRCLHGIHLPVRNRNVLIADCHIYENRGIGIYLDDVNLHQINVTGCHVSYCRGGGVVSRAGNVRNLHVTGCDIEANMDPAGPPTANVLIDCTGGAWGTAEIAVTGCTIQHTAHAPESANIRLIGTDGKGRPWGNLTISGNVLSDTQINVDIQKAAGVTIVGNTFWQGQHYNLRVANSRNIVVGPNVLERNAEYEEQDTRDHGILFSGCHDCTITGLHVAGVRRRPAGIVLEQCRRLHLTGCTVLDCENAALLLKDCTDCRVSDCLLASDLPADPPWQPIVVVGGSENTVNP